MLTGSFGRFDVSKSNTTFTDSVPVDVGLITRDVNALGLGPLLEVLRRTNGGAEGSGDEKEGSREGFEVEQHGCWEFLPFVSSPSISGRGIGGFCTYDKRLATRTPSVRISILVVLPRKSLVAYFQRDVAETSEYP